MRKLLVSAIVAGATLIGAAGSASAGDLSIGLSIGVPARPVYVAPPPAYYYYPPAYAAPVIVAPQPRYYAYPAYSYSYPAYPGFYAARWHKHHWHHDDDNDND